MLPTLLLGLSLVLEASALKVAIIGAGAGGSSAAYWLSLAKQRAPAGTIVEATVYEQESHVGGRSTTIYPYNDSSYAPIELGASIFAAGNLNMMRAASEFGLELARSGGATPGMGIWDGTKFVWRTVGDDNVDESLMEARYQTGPAVSGRFIVNFQTSFAKSYTPAFPQFQNISAYSAALGYTSLSPVTLKSYFDQNGVNKNWTNDFMTGSTRFNYGQDISAINAVAGLTSLSAGAAYSVKTGNYKVFQRFLARSGATIKLSTKVTSITKIGPKYTVAARRGVATFDSVIIAVPLPLANIKFYNLPQPSSFPPVTYVHLHVTLVATTTPALLPAYFKVDNSAPLPGTLLTTAEYGTQPGLNALRYQEKIQRNGKTEYIVKIFSKAKISDATLTTWFGQCNVGWVYRKEWDAFPYFPPRSDFPPVKIDKGLYYVNAMEGLWSTMETETISSRNVVDILGSEMWGSGLCGPGGAKGPVTDTYVLGWDC